MPLDHGPGWVHPATPGLPLARTAPGHTGHRVLDALADHAQPAGTGSLVVAVTLSVDGLCATCARTPATADDYELRRDMRENAGNGRRLRVAAGRGGVNVVQITLDESKAYVDDFHDHSNVHVGHKWSLAAVIEGRLVGVAVIGRPTAQVIQNSDPWALEVTRVCVERVGGAGYPNACSFLYAASWRSIKAMGYLRALTYTKEGENGASILAAGWLPIARRKPRKAGWESRPGRASGGVREGGERWEIRAAAWRADLPARPRVLLPGQMDVVA